MSPETVDPRVLDRAEVRATYEITIGPRRHTVRIARLGDGTSGLGGRFAVQVDGGPVRTVESTRPQADVLNLLVGSATWEAGLVDREEGFDVELLGIRHGVEVADPRRKALRLAAVAGAAAVKTQMPGRIVRVLVQAGEVVAKGQALVVVEAMKMENELKAPREGTVKRVAVSEGALVESGAVLVELD